MGNCLTTRHDRESNGRLLILKTQLFEANRVTALITIQVFTKDIYNEKYLKSLNLNESQIKSVLYLKKKGKINNSDYQNLNNVSRATATRDLKQLNNKQLIMPSGQKRSR